MLSKSKHSSVNRLQGDSEGLVLPQNPRKRFPDLFERVAEAKIFEDPKAWTDVIFNAPPEVILEAFKKENPMSTSELKAFTARYFKEHEALADNLPKEENLENETVESYLNGLWHKLLRPPHPDAAEELSSIISLPKEYIVPGGRFNEIYYWDSYFTMLAFADRNPVMIQNMVDNFASMINRFGFIPNGNRTYFLSRSQPPFFHRLVGLLDPDNNAAAYARYIKELCREYGFWMNRDGDIETRCVKIDENTYLNRYFDASDQPRDESYVFDLETAEASDQKSADLYRNIRAGAESGWDFSSRWFGDPTDMASIRTTLILPVDLNAILYGLELAISEGYEHLGEKLESEKYKALADKRRNAISKYFWNAESGCFFDYDIEYKKQTSVVSGAALFPLFFNCCSEEQAQSIAKQTEAHLLKPGGLVATSIETGEQWDSPNGWAPLQWVAISGLKQYGHTELAAEIADRWMKMVTSVYNTTGALYEKYDVVNMSLAGGGEYLVQEGFGWTNGVMATLLKGQDDS